MIIKILKFKICLVLFSFCAIYTNAQHTDLRSKINAILIGKKATVGIAIEGYDGKDTLTNEGNKRFPMHSVFKFFIAHAILHKVDHGKIDLNKKIEIKKSDLDNNFYSPIRDKYPNGVILKVSELIQYMVSESDNIACDLLLKLYIKPSELEAYIHKQGVKNIAIKYNEAAQETNWDYQYSNWITPKAANQLLKYFYENKGSLLSKKSYQFLWSAMKSTKTGEKRFRGQLPAETIIAHKTGSSGKNKEGLTGACNDIGIIFLFLPNGKYFYLSVLVTNSVESEEINEKIIAEISKAAWDYFSEKYK